MRAEHRNWRRYLRMKSVLAINLTLVALIIWGFAGEYARNRGLQQEISALDAQAEALRQDNLELASMKEKFAGGGELEREARLKLNLQKPGEEVVVIQGEIARAGFDAESTAPAAETEAAEGRVADNVRRWWEFFFEQH